MYSKKRLLAGCLILTLPLNVAAAPPKDSPGCKILAPASVSAEVPFPVVVSRDPPYPGQWFAPTISVDLEVPVDPSVPLSPNSYSQTVTMSVDGLGGSNDATATFYIPYLGNIVSGAPVRLSATVSEPVGKKKQAVVAACEAVMVIN